MAWYEISTARIAEAGEDITSFVEALCVLRERLDGIIFELPGDSHIIRQQKQISGRLKDISSNAKDAARTLSEITDIYSDAERRAFGGDVKHNKTTADQTPRPSAAPPRIARKSSRVTLFSDLIMPDWLQAAVIKYEQSIK